MPTVDQIRSQVAYLRARLERGAERVSVARGMGWTRRIEPALLVGVAISIFVHVLLALFAVLVVFDRDVPSLGSPDGEVRLAVLTQAELTDLLNRDLSPTDPLAESNRDPEVFSIADVLTPTSSAELAALEASDLSQLSAAIGDPSGTEAAGVLGGSGQFSGTAQFFGIEAQGSRFAFIVDVSGSMQGERIASLKRALADSVIGLLEHSYFVIIPFSSDAVPLMGTRWITASDRQKQSALSAISALTPSGGTNPIPAFEMVFDMKPRPDAIYFMTDGQLSAELEDRIVAVVDRMNRSGDRRSQIHCISFLVRDRQTESLMRRIARLSGGSYTHIERITP